MYDLAVLGSGPGGYVAAIRAKQLGMDVVVVEKSELGGTCLNWGCIPTKALLKSATVYRYASHADVYGVKATDVKPDFEGMIKRSRNVAATMSKGINFLFNKNKINVVQGYGRLLNNHSIKVTREDGVEEMVEAKKIIIATGTRPKDLPGIKRDGVKIFGYREAMSLPKQPESMVVIGSGAIGTEFAHFYQSIGTKVTLVEFMPNILPLEDAEITKLLSREFRKMKMNVLTSSSVTNVNVDGDVCRVSITTPKGDVEVEADCVFVAAGVTTNIEDIGIDQLGIKVERGKIVVDGKYMTSVEGIYAIGDIVPGQALAHVASAEAVCCVNNIAGIKTPSVDYGNVPSCTYCSPEVASVGMTEEKALAAGYEIKIGRFPFTASGKATASGNREGMIKLILDAKNDEILGAHFIGDNVTEMIATITLARKLHATSGDVIGTIFPHPTMSEAIKEATEEALGECIHL